MKTGSISTQVRVPSEMWDYISAQAEEMGIAKNAMLTILLQCGKKLWEADVSRQAG